MRATISGVDVECESRWWNQWNVTGESAFPVPEKLILFVSAKGMDHGFWRDLLVGDPAFDDRFFIFCDTPALLPVVLGEATRQALRDAGPNRHDIELYVRDGRVRTKSITFKTDVTTIDRHLAVHRALAADHRGFLKRWQDQMSDASGRAELVWPPNATLLRPSGALLVNLAWTAPTTRDASDWEDAATSMRTEITVHDDRPRATWSLREVGPSVACTHVFGKRRFVLAGPLPIRPPVLDGIVERSDLASITVRANRITVGVHGIATARQIDGAVRIVQILVEATADTTSPYR